MYNDHGRCKPFGGYSEKTFRRSKAKITPMRLYWDMTPPLAKIIKDSRNFALKVWRKTNWYYWRTNVYLSFNAIPRTALTILGTARHTSVMGPTHVYTFKVLRGNICDLISIGVKSWLANKGITIERFLPIAWESNLDWLTKESLSKDSCQ